MKTTLTIYAIAALLLVSSCKNEKQAPDTINVPDTTAVDTDLEKKPLSEFRKALAALPGKERIEVFDALSNEMKAGLWRDRIEETIPALDNEEQEVMRSLLQQVTPTIYADSGKAFFEGLASWEKSALDAFDNDSIKLYSIITLLDDPLKDDGAIAPVPGKKEPCDCSIPSDFCWLRGLNLVCANPNCVPTKGGCGRFWRFPCDALCIVNPNPGG